VRWRSVDARSGLIAAGTAILALLAIRHIPLFYCLGIPALAPAFRGIAPIVTVDSDVPEGDVTRPSTRLVLAYSALMLVVLAAVAARFWKAPNVDRAYPDEAAAYVRRNGITRVWNDWGEGGYLMFRGVPPLVDGRGDPFVEYANPKMGDFAVEYAAGALAKRDIRPLLRDLEVDYLIVGRDRRLYEVLRDSADFRRVHTDSTHAVFRYEP